VIVTECSPDRIGVTEQVPRRCSCDPALSVPPGSSWLQANLYSAAGIPVAVISDATVASVMERVDLALVGAEAVVESGGIINRTGPVPPCPALLAVRCERPRGLAQALFSWASFVQP
jgi:hypothetical protein